MTNDLVSKLLAAIEAEEEGADQVARRTITRYGPNGTFRGWRPRSEERYQAILRRCTADRRRLERHTPVHTVVPDYTPPPGSDWPFVHCGHCKRQWPCPDFLDLANSYGITDDTPEPGSALANDLAEGLAQAQAGDTVPAEVIADDLQRRRDAGEQETT